MTRLRRVAVITFLVLASATSAVAGTRDDGAPGQAGTNGVSVVVQGSSSISVSGANGTDGANGADGTSTRNGANGVNGSSSSNVSSNVSSSTVITHQESSTMTSHVVSRSRITVRTGSEIGMIKIPRLGVHGEVRQGILGNILALGPGHYPLSGMPGCGTCTVAIAGHRVTPVPGYGPHGPFRYINLLRKGDVIQIARDGQTFTYRIFHTAVVTPNVTWVFNDVGYERLVLTACTPPFSATYRYIVFAKRVA